MSATWCALLLMVLADLWLYAVGFSCVSAQYATFFFPDFFTLCLTATRYFLPYRQTGRLDL